VSKHLADYVQQAAQDAITAYQHARCIGSYHPDARDAYAIPVIGADGRYTTHFPRQVAERLSRSPDGDHFYRVDVEVTYEVTRAGWDWRVEVALAWARTPSPEHPYFQDRRLLLAVACERPDVEVETITSGLKAFGQTLPAMLLALANGQFS
jgi:hypothetical protein